MSSNISDSFDKLLPEPITQGATEQLLADADNWRYFVNESSNSKSLVSDLAAHLSFYREEVERLKKLMEKNKDGKQ